MRSSAFSLLLGWSGATPSLISFISNANVIGRTPGGLAGCRAMPQAMFLFGAVFPVNLKSVLRHKTEEMCSCVQ